jgi:adenine deaminase
VLTWERIGWKLAFNEEALQSATVLPAEMLGMRSSGSVAPGYVADIVAVERSLADINCHWQSALGDEGRQCGCRQTKQFCRPLNTTSG